VPGRTRVRADLRLFTGRAFPRRVKLDTNVHKCDGGKGALRAPIKLVLDQPVSFCRSSVSNLSSEAKT
jgi:hypothetical protein